MASDVPCTDSAATAHAPGRHPDRALTSLEWDERDVARALRDPADAEFFRHAMDVLAPTASVNTRVEMCMLLLGDFLALTVGQAEMVEAHLDIVDKALLRAGYGAGHALRCEMRSVAHEALVQAMQSWDGQLGPFAPHARCCVARALKDARGKARGVRRRQRLEREAQAGASGQLSRGRATSIDPARGLHPHASGIFNGASFVDLSAPDAEDSAIRDAEGMRLRAATARLSAPQRTLLQAVYGEGITVTAYARRIGVTHGSAHRMHKRALAKLRELLGDDQKLGA